MKPPAPFLPVSLIPLQLTCLSSRYHKALASSLFIDQWIKLCFKLSRNLVSLQHQSPVPIPDLNLNESLFKTVPVPSWPNLPLVACGSTIQKEWAGQRAFKSRVLNWQQIITGVNHRQVNVLSTYKHTIRVLQVGTSAGKKPMLLQSLHHIHVATWENIIEKCTMH